MNLPIQYLRACILGSTTCLAVILCGCCPDNQTVVAEGGAIHTQEFMEILRLADIDATEATNERIQQSAIALASDPDAWPLSWIILSRGQKPGFSHGNIEDIVPLVVISKMIESMHPDADIEICYAIIDWLDVADRPMFSETTETGLFTQRRSERLGVAPRDAARKYLVNRYGVDHEYDKAAWKQYLDASDYAR